MKQMLSIGFILTITGFLNAQSAVLDTNFCKYLSEFIAYHHDGFDKNMDGQDFDEMGLDTLQRDGEDDLDFTIRKTSATVAQMIYRDKIAYRVLYALYEKGNANIITDKSKNCSYYKESVPFDVFSTDIGPMRDQLVAQFLTCSEYETYPIVKEPFDFKAGVDPEWLWMYENTTMDVFKLKYYQTNLRIVIHVDHSAGMGHFYLYIIDKEHLLDIR